MTKAEYEARNQELRDKYICDSDYFGRLVDVDSEYIESLESENARLEKQIKNAVDDIEATLKCLPFASYIDKVKILERTKYILTAEPQEEK